jgi:hypothetical protein
MRFWSICALFIAACGSSSGSSGGTASGDRGTAMSRTRVYFRQYYKQSHTFAVENFAGRDEVELRSRPRNPDEPALAFVPDEVMEKMLSEFKRFGFYDYAGPRPADPSKLGGRGELTIVDAKGRQNAFIRVRGQGKDAFDAYQGCIQTFLAVHDHYGRFQASTSGGAAFGVKKAEFGGG